MPTPVQAALAAALISGLFTIFGFVLVRRKEDQTRRQEAALRHLQRQIEELYGPLVGLLQQSQSAYEVAKARFRLKDSERINHSNLTDEEHQIWDYFVDTYLVPINTEIMNLLLTKAFLIETLTLPDSFNEFVRHATMFEMLHRLWKIKNIDSSFIPGVPYPQTFDQDVLNTLTELRRRYNDYLLRLGAKGEHKAIRHTA